METNIVEEAQKEVDRNYSFFKTQITQLKGDHLNEFALLHNETINDFFKDEDDAIKIGLKEYGEGKFSVQQVNNKSVELGYQSCVII